tara:strand:+ start:8314 stop:9510 length:1197 start_codon:yes stop_codon:yes gene_type:complete
MAQVFVLDPGMREDGGHHAALVSTLLNYKGLEQIKLTLISYQSLDASMLSQAKKSNVEVVQHFNTNFYENYDKTYSVGKLQVQRYIRHLATEYIAAWNMATEKCRNKAQELIFFYPCLNYEHAAALSLAFIYLDKHSDIHEEYTHKICCMFTPNDVHEEIYKCRYRQAFAPLARRKEVQLYASDAETMRYYESLGIELKGIHPCYLLPWEQIKITDKVTSQSPRILLYFGDAKTNKGFCDVPSLARRLLSEYENNVTLIIQYTLAWEQEDLVQTIDALNKLNATYKQVHLFNEFWSPDQLAEKFDTLDLIYCTYDPQVYQYKSSGLAWLASFFTVPVVLKGQCWLSREFDRLGHYYSFMEGSHNLPAAIEEKSKESSYYVSLFENLITWLKGPYRVSL